MRLRVLRLVLPVGVEGRGVFARRPVSLLRLLRRTQL